MIYEKFMYDLKKEKIQMERLGKRGLVVRFV